MYIYIIYMETNQVKIPKFKLKSKALKSHYTYASILTSIIAELEKIPELQSLKLSQDLTALCCSIVESVKISGTNPIDKKTLVTEILQKIFNLTSDEQVSIGTQIDFICSNDLHLAKNPIYDSIKKFFF